jgi:ADP-heptose:LPS heptosyltransferase
LSDDIEAVAPGVPQFVHALTPADVVQDTTLRRILILKLDHIGDILIAAPALALLRASFPEAHITLICGPWNVGLATRLGIADEIHSVNIFAHTSAGDAGAKGAEARRRAAVETIERLKPTPFDLAIDLRRDTDTRELLKLFSARHTAGFGDLDTFNFLDIALPTPVELRGHGATHLKLTPADLDAGVGHRISEHGLHMTAEVGEAEMELRTDTVWPPADDGIPDTRLLGVALWRIDVRTRSVDASTSSDLDDPVEVRKDDMRFDAQWLEGEPWGRWSSAHRSAVTLRFPTQSSEVELLARVQGHTSPSHPTARVTIAVAGAEVSHVFHAGDAPVILALRCEAKRAPMPVTTQPLLLHAGRYRVYLRIVILEGVVCTPLVVTLRGGNLGHVIARYTASGFADVSSGSEDVTLCFDFEHRDSAEPLVAEITSIEPELARHIAIAGLDFECTDLRAPKLPLAHMELKLLDLAAMVAIRFSARPVFGDPAIVVKRLGTQRKGSSAPAAVEQLAARKLQGKSRWSLARRSRTRMLIGIGIGANKQTKLWPNSHFVELCRLLLDQPDVDLVFVGGPSEAGPIELMIEQLGAGERTINLCQSSKIEDLGEILAMLDGFVGLDTGTTHFAGRMGIRTVAIFGHAHLPKEWGPVGDHATWVAADVVCRGCSYSDAAQCPVGVACMSGLSPLDVWSAVRRHLFDRAAVRQGGLDPPKPRALDTRLPV